MKENDYLNLLENGDFDKLELYIKKYPDILKSKGTSFCPLCEATQIKELPDELLETMLQFGADPNEKALKDFNPLYNVSWFCDIEKAKILLKYGANINQVNAWNIPPIGNCVMSPFFNKEYFLFLVKNGSDYKFIDTDNETIIDYAEKNTIFSDNTFFFSDIYNNDYSYEQIKRKIKDDLEINTSKQIESIYNSLILPKIEGNFVSNIFNKIFNESGLAVCLNTITSSFPYTTSYIDINTNEDITDESLLKKKVSNRIKSLYYPNYDNSIMLDSKMKQLSKLLFDSHDVEALSFIGNKIFKNERIPIDSLLAIYYILFRYKLKKEAKRILNIVDIINNEVELRYNIFCEKRLIEEIRTIVDENDVDRFLSIAQRLAKY